MIEIPGGGITLRDHRIKKTWKVNIEPFLLSKYPVTQEVYFAITNKNPSSHKGNKNPIENISWDDAISFCEMLSNGYRLPTEAGGRIRDRYLVLVNYCDILHKGCLKCQDKLGY